MAKSPDKIPGLKLWFDAADRSTINDGRVTNLQNVYKWTDKVSGVNLLNNSGIYGPTYSFGGVNGKNAIRHSWYTTATEPGAHMSNKCLVSPDVVPQLSSGTFSLYYVVRPDGPERVSQVGAGGSAALFGAEKSTALSFHSLARFRTLTSLTGYTAEREYFFVNDGTSNQSPNSIPQWRDGLNGSNTNSAGLTTHINYDMLAIWYPLATSGKAYHYGKVNIMSIRSSSLLKRHTISRPDYTKKDSFQARSSNPANFDATGRDARRRDAFSIPDPILVIGGIWPGSVVSGVVNLTWGSVNTWSIQGFSCEFLFYDRVLNEKENNEVRNYLIDKWGR